MCPKAGHFFDYRGLFKQHNKPGKPFVFASSINKIGYPTTQGMCLITQSGRGMGRKYVRVHVCPDWTKTGSRQLCGFCPYKPLTNVICATFQESQVWTQPVFNKACFKFGSKIVVVVLILPSGINTTCFFGICV